MNARTSQEQEGLAPDLAWAAYLLASWWAPGGGLPAPAAPADPAAVVELLRRSGTPLLTLADDSRPAAADLLAAPPFRAAIAEQQTRMARQMLAFAEIRAGWAAAGIPALFVKAMGPQPIFPYISNNLDILVPQPQQDAARKIVRDLGYVELRHIEEPNKFLFRRYHLGASAFDLHIHGRLEWHVEFLDTPAVWQRATAQSALAAVPAPEDGILIALAHAIYENKALKLIELAKIVYAARVLDVDWERVADGAQRKGWLPGLWFGLSLCDRLEDRLYGAASLPAAVRDRIQRDLPARLAGYVTTLFAQPPRAPVRISFLRSKRLFYEKILADPTRTAAGRAEDVVSHTLYGTRVKLRLHSQRPLLIALDGVDGSGKSAQAEIFDRALAEAALRHRVVWTRGGSSAALQPLLKLGKRLLGRNTEDEDVRSAHFSAPKRPLRTAAPATTTDENGYLRPSAASAIVVGAGSERSGAEPPEQAREAERAALFRHPLVRALWPWLMACELGVAYLARVRWPLLRGEVVVADRYVLSALMELGARLERPDIARTPAARLLRLVAPAPDRAYWLDVPAEAALARKEGREAPAFLARQAALLPQLAEEAGADRLDGTQPAGAISDRIIPETLRGYLDAHRTLLNGLFWANPRPLPREWTAGDSAGESTP